MELYNKKVRVNGEYAPFYGWTVVAMVDSACDLKFIENYLTHHQVLREYFSPLPSSSYHMTVYNIWSNGSMLLPHQDRFLQQNFDQYTCENLKSQSRSIGDFNPNGCINGLLDRMHYSIKNSAWGTIKLTIHTVRYTGGTIGILLKDAPEFATVNKIRSNMTELAEKNDKMGCYHITLGYKYKDFDKTTKNTIDEEVAVLNMLLQGQTITLSLPIVAKFCDMTEFTPVY